MIGNDQTFLQARLYDGAVLSMMKEVIQKSISGELHLIVPEGH
jgi:hypothetical protein